MVIATRHELQEDQQLLLDLTKGTSHRPDELPDLLRALLAKETLVLDDWLGYPGMVDTCAQPVDTALIWSIRMNVVWPQQCMGLLLDLGASSTRRSREESSPLEVLSARVVGTNSAEISAACGKMLIDAGGLDVSHCTGTGTLRFISQRKNKTRCCASSCSPTGGRRRPPRRWLSCARG